jgi:glutathione S-transferase
MAWGWVTIVAMLALVQYVYLGLLVGRARGLYGVEAPATTGHALFERAYRIHQNTLEQLIVFLPGLVAFGSYVDPLWAAIVGVVYLIGRTWYAVGYQADPKKRGPGMMMTFLANAVLVLGGLIGAVLSLV